MKPLSVSAILLFLLLSSCASSVETRTDCERVSAFVDLLEASESTGPAAPGLVKERKGLVESPPAGLEWDLETVLPVADQEMRRVVVDNVVIWEITACGAARGDTFYNRVSDGIQLSRLK